MAASLACLQARIDTFSGPASSKSRRTSTKSKKAPTKSKNAWPLALPSSHDLAFAGFVWKPTTASPDNVQCFSCHCQLDGWEENDVPAFEHLTHSPSCGFAVVTCIRLRSGDSGRSEDDPISDAMMQARRDTFGDQWPLDSNEGYPSVEQLVEAGWYYDPTIDTTDGATCAYCSLSLDEWDVGDDPMEEHRRREPECLFFALKELYHPTQKATTKKGKRASTRSSNASTIAKPTRGKKRVSEQIDDSIASVAAEKPTRGKKTTSEDIDTTVEEIKPKATRGRKRASTQIDDSIASVVEKPTRGKKRASTQIDNSMDSVDAVEEVKPKAARGRKAANAQIDNTLDSVEPVEEIKPKSTRGKKPANTHIDDTNASVIEKPTRGKKKALEKIDTTMDDVQDEALPAPSPEPVPAPEPKATKSKKAAPKPKRASSASTASTTRGKKRMSEEVEDIQAVELSPKRVRHSSVSSFGDSLLAGTPRATPGHFKAAEPMEVEPAAPELDDAEPEPEPELEELEADMSSLPASIVIGTLRKTPPRATTPETTTKPHASHTTWDPIDIDTFFSTTEDLKTLINDVVIDAGLDAIVPDGATQEDLQAAVLAGLTKAEKEMTVEQWVLYNAKRGEEKLRQACERQIVAFEGQAKKARAAIEGLPTH